eukprot:SAG25_NODE_981_length_4424_cov_16.211561_7_plen_110_part_00
MQARAELSEARLMTAAQQLDWAIPRAAAVLRASTQSAQAEGASEVDASISSSVFDVTADSSMQREQSIATAAAAAAAAPERIGRIARVGTRARAWHEAVAPAVSDGTNA